MLHRAILGSMECWIGILIEQHAGRFPRWLSPLQVVVATITNNADGYAAEVAKACEAAGLRVAMDRRNEKINYKIREHSEATVLAILVVGAREAEGRSVAVRRLAGQPPHVLAWDDAANRLRMASAAPRRRAAKSE